MVSSLLVLLASRFLSFRRGSIWRSLFWAFSSHNCCHLFVIICLILCFKSVYSSLEVLSGGMLKIDLVSHTYMLYCIWVPYIFFFWPWSSLSKSIPITLLLLSEVHLHYGVNVPVVNFWKFQPSNFYNSLAKIHQMKTPNRRVISKSGKSFITRSCLSSV